MNDKPELTQSRLKQDTRYLWQHPDDTGSPAYRDCLQWRFEHERFLTDCLSLLRKATGDMPEVVCTARLKRMDSILKKIRRSPYSIRDMRDIAGCRVIVPDMRGLKEARERIEKAFRTESLDSQLKDYISQPEESGYRGVHWDLRKKGKPCDRAEVQLRTMKQHLWATTVETASLLYRTDLKHASELGDDAHGETIASLLRDMSLCWIAADELGQRPNASDLERFRSELQPADKLQKTETDDFFTKLRIFAEQPTDISEETETNSQDGGLYVLIFSSEDNTVRRQTFPMNRIENAIEAFNQAEAAGSVTGRKGADETAVMEYNSVLVAAPDEKSLALAYPNYLGGSEACDDGFSLTKEAALNWIKSW